MHLSYMKTKTRKNYKTKKTGGNKMQLRTTFNVFRGSPHGGVLTCEIHEYSNNDIKIDIYANKESGVGNRNYEHMFLTIKSVGHISNEYLPLYKLVFEDGRYSNSVQELLYSVESITKFIIAKQKSLDDCHTMLDTCESEKKSLGNENKTLISRIAKISTELHE